MQASAANAAAAAAERYDALAQAYGELKSAWETRGPRDEDVATMQALRNDVAQRDAQLGSVEERFLSLRNVRP